MQESLGRADREIRLLPERVKKDMLPPAPKLGRREWGSLQRAALRNQNTAAMEGSKPRVDKKQRSTAAPSEERKCPWFFAITLKRPKEPSGRYKGTASDILIPVS